MKGGPEVVLLFANKGRQKHCYMRNGHNKHSRLKGGYPRVGKIAAAY